MGTGNLSACHAWTGSGTCPSPGDERAGNTPVPGSQSHRPLSVLVRSLSAQSVLRRARRVLEYPPSTLHVDQGDTLIRSYALYGLGGVGKTQLALEYAYRHALEYSAIFWIGAESFEHIVTSLLHIAEVLQLLEREEKDQQRVVAAVQQWLSIHSQWLLIWDNVEDLDLIEQFLPPARRGAILITTRCLAFGTFAQGLKLESMESEEGILFLLRRAKVVMLKAGDGLLHQDSIQTHPAVVTAATLVKVLGGLPLALDQAAAYLEETGCSLNDYLSLYERQQARMLDRRGIASRDHPQSVMATLRLSLGRIGYEQQVSVDLLRVCALLHADAIPEEVFVEGAVHLGPALAPLASDPVLFNAAIAVLHRFSLVSRQAEDHVLSLHRLVQTVLQTSLAEAERQTWQERIIAAISHLFPANEEAHPDYFQRCERLLPHAQICLSWEKSTDRSVFHRIALLTHVAAYLLRRSRLSEAESLYQQARIEAEHVLEPDHLLLADTFEGLAELRTLLARYEEAECLYQRALHIRERAFGGGHLQVAALYNGLGMLYWRQGKYSEAVPLHQRALDICRRALGADHPQIANALSQLAMIWRVQGEYEQAESLYLQALQIREHAFGLADPHMGLSFYHLAALYLEQARYEAAKRFFVRAIHIWEESLGPEDLDLAFAFTGLAKVPGEQGCYEDAETLFRRALRTRESVLGTDHPQIAAVLHGLANLFQKQQKYVQAEQLYQQALNTQEKYLGQQHTDTAEILHDFALLRQRQSNPGEAISLAEQAYTIRLQSLGDAHPKTVASRMLTAQLIQ